MRKPRRYSWLQEDAIIDIDTEAGDADRIAVRLKAEFPDFSVERFITNYPVTNSDAVHAIRHAAQLAAAPSEQ